VCSVCDAVKVEANDLELLSHISSRRDKAVYIFSQSSETGAK
jgi:hypothetical protein